MKFIFYTEDFGLTNSDAKKKKQKQTWFALGATCLLQSTVGADLSGVQRWVLCEMISQLPRQGAYILSCLTHLYHALWVDPQGSANLSASLLTEAVE